MRRTGLMRGAMLAGVLAWSASGCGGPARVAEPPAPGHIALEQLGEMYQGYTREHKRPPARMEELEGYAPGFPEGYLELQRGTLVVRWGAPTTQTPDAVLAFEKATPQQGGHVLMQDGSTVKTMTAREFEAAPKANGG